MAFTFDSAQSFRLGSGGVTSTWSHIVGSGTHRLLVVLHAKSTSSSIGPSAITYAGIQLVNYGEFTNATYGTVSIWALIDPPSGTADIVATHVSSAVNRFHSASFLSGGVPVFDRTASGFGITDGSDNTTVTITPTYANSLVVDTVAIDDTTPATARGADQTLLFDSDDGSVSSSSSYRLATPASSYSATHQASAWASDNYLAAAAAFYESDGNGPPTFVGAGTAAFTATASATITPGLPSGWAADDIHVLVAGTSDNSDFPEPSGWTKITPSSVAENNGAQRVEIWWRRAVGGDTAPVLSTFTGVAVRGARIFGVRGCPASGDPFAGMSRLNNGSGSATISTTSITPSKNETLNLFLYVYEDDPTGGTDTAAWSDLSVATSSLGNDMAIGHAVMAQAVAASINPSTTVSGGTFANSVSAAFLLSFAPLPSLVDITTVSDPAASADTTGSVTWGGAITTSVDAAVGADRTGSIVAHAFISGSIDPAAAADTPALLSWGVFIGPSSPQTASAIDTTGEASTGSTIVASVDPSVAADTIAAVDSIAPITTIADPVSAHDTTASIVASVDIVAVADPATATDTLATIGGGSSASIASSVASADADGFGALVAYGMRVIAGFDPAMTQDTTGSIDLGMVILASIDAALAPDIVGSVRSGTAIATSADVAMAQDTTAIVTETQTLIITTVVDPAVVADTTGSLVVHITITATANPASAGETGAQIFVLSQIASVAARADATTTEAVIAGLHEILGSVVVASASGHPVTIGLRVIFGYDASRGVLGLPGSRRSLVFDASKSSSVYLAERPDV